MIIQTGQRTDILAFYPEWLHNRLKAGFVMVRNPYKPDVVTRYSLSPDVVDLITFCTKNPEPFFEYMGDLEPYTQFWYMTITPYGTHIEPNVPNFSKGIENFKKLSDMVGPDHIGWRYDPVFITENYSVEKHIEYFEKMASELSGYTHLAVFSFLDLYRKVQRNFPEGKKVTEQERAALAQAFAKTGMKYNMTVKACAEGDSLEKYGIDCSGCFIPEMFEGILHGRLNVPAGRTPREECGCILSGDIGAYNSCGHLCRYCYANADAELVKHNMKLHDPKSPFLIGHEEPGDILREARQESWLDFQLNWFGI